MGKYKYATRVNTSLTSTENKFNSASIGASFAPSGLTDISVSANKGNGNSKESVASYSLALISAKNDLSLTFGKDMDIIGGRGAWRKDHGKDRRESEHRDLAGEGNLRGRQPHPHRV